MRVLQISGSLPPMKCGVGDYTACLAEALAGLPGVEVGVLTSVEASPGRPQNSFDVLATIEKWGRDELGRAMQVARDWKADVVHVQYPTQGYGTGTLPWLLPPAFWRRGTPVVQTWHEHFFGMTYQPNWHGFRWAAYCLALTPGDVVVVRPDYRENMSRWWRVVSRHKSLELVPSAPSIPRVLLSDEERVEIRRRFAPDGRALLVFFGFFFEHKGIDDLLRIMDPVRHRLVLVGEVKDWDPYQTALVERLRREPYASAVEWAGFLEPLEAGRILAAADAVVLPLRTGAGSWNTSLQAAILQGTFLLTTSLERHGYDADRNTYFARPGDLSDLKEGLDRHLGRRNPVAPDERLLPTWPSIARKHLAIYERALR
jgi:glycosyltransferase involved in cell wall biosynthesis